MVVVDAVAHLAAVLQAQLVPRCGRHITAPVLLPLNVWLVAQHACTALADVGNRQEGTDVQAHPVVEIGVPADGLPFDRFPPHEDVIGRLARQDQLKALLQRLCGGQLLLGSVDAVVRIALLAAEPVTQVGVDQGLQCLVVELVVIH